MFRDPVFDGQFLRAIGHAFYGGAEVGECFAVAARIRDGDSASWFRAWTDAADHLVAAGTAALAAGAPDVARASFLRASNYYRSSSITLLGEPIDPRVRDAYRAQLGAFTRAAALMTPAGERLAIPFGDTPLAGWFFRAPGATGPRPLVIVNGGYDGTAEELYFMCAAGAVARGYDCLVFDGPGQAGALIESGLHLRPDWEVVVRAVVDAALARPTTDPARVVLIGESLGGYLAARAAAFEPRLAALVLDPGEFDLGAAARGRLPMTLDTLQRLPSVARRGFFALAERNPTVAWVFRRGMMTHGTESPLAYLEALAPYRIGELATQIRCPVLVCRADSDPISDQAPQVFAALTAPRTYLEFHAADGAGEHCEMGARSLFVRQVFDWLDRTLGMNGIAASA